MRFRLPDNETKFNSISIEDSRIELAGDSLLRIETSVLKQTTILYTNPEGGVCVIVPLIKTKSNINIYQYISLLLSEGYNVYKLPQNNLKFSHLLFTLESKSWFNLVNEDGITILIYPTMVYTGQVTVFNNVYSGRVDYSFKYI